MFDQFKEVTVEEENKSKQNFSDLSNKNFENEDNWISKEQVEVLLKELKNDLKKEEKKKKITKKTPKISISNEILTSHKKFIDNSEILKWKSSKKIKK